MPEVSIIVPVYNVEPYLKDCLKSILQQTFTNFEVICVNDGSTDSSLNIITEFAKCDNRINIIDQDNIGYGATINNAVLRALGPYIMVVDSDDMLCSSAVEVMLNAIRTTKADFVQNSTYIKLNNITGAQTIYNFAKIQNLKTYAEAQIINILDYQELLHTRMAPLWGRIYKKEIFKSIRLSRTIGAAYQDTSFHWLLYLSPEYTKVGFINKNIYKYRLGRPNQSVRAKDNLHFAEFEINKVLSYISENKHNINADLLEGLSAAMIRFMHDNYERVHTAHKVKALKLTHTIIKHIQKEGWLKNKSIKQLLEHEV